MARATERPAPTSARRSTASSSRASRMIVVTAVDTDVYTPAGPPVEVFETRLGFLGNGNRQQGDEPVRPVRRVAGEVADPAAVGVAVDLARGAPPPSTRPAAS